MYKVLPFHNSNTQKNASFVLTVTALPQKAINSKLFLEFATYDKKRQSFFLFQKHPKVLPEKLTVRTELAYFSITSILNTSKAELAVNCNKSKNAFK